MKKVWTFLTALLVIMPFAFADIITPWYEYPLVVGFSIIGLLLLYICIVGVNTLVEFPVVFLFGRKAGWDKTRSYANSFLANIVSGWLPLLMAIFATLPGGMSIAQAWAAIIFVELLVILLEGWIYQKLMMQKGMAYVTATAANVFSVAVGYALLWIGMAARLSPNSGVIALTIFGVLSAIVGIVVLRKIKDKNTTNITKPTKKAFKIIGIIAGVLIVLSMIWGIIAESTPKPRYIDPQMYVSETVKSFAITGVEGGVIKHLPPSFFSCTWIKTP
ncbi:MAG: hypothetical protein PWP76_555 [Candidatus Diapherotrites archaeon]|nr:hypothetical protein [Candidatus Diapherotrites archaeon]MDN5366627.1 hypothetical protein [Candidatus Diapherotrites archaeon]